MDEKRFKALLRELKELRRQHDAMTDKLDGLEERVTEALAAPPGEPSKGAEDDPLFGVK